MRICEIVNFGNDMMYKTEKWQHDAAVATTTNHINASIKL